MNASAYRMRVLNRDNHIFQIAIAHYIRRYSIRLFNFLSLSVGKNVERKRRHNTFRVAVFSTLYTYVADERPLANMFRFYLINTMIYYLFRMR